jgi:hypothetical protein
MSCESHEPWALVTCPVCDGDGEWDEGPLPASSGATEPDYRQVICPECKGNGRAFVEVEPITLDDLEEMAAPGEEQWVTR